MLLSLSDLGPSGPPRPQRRMLVKPWGFRLGFFHGSEYLVCLWAIKMKYVCRTTMSWDVYIYIYTYIYIHIYIYSMYIYIDITSVALSHLTLNPWVVDHSGEPLGM